MGKWQNPNTNTKPKCNKSIREERRLNIISVLEKGGQTRKSVAGIFNLPYSIICTIYLKFLSTGKTNKVKSKVKSWKN